MLISLYRIVPLFSCLFLLFLPPSFYPSFLPSFLLSFFQSFVLSIFILPSFFPIFSFFLSILHSLLPSLLVSCSARLPPPYSFPPSQLLLTSGEDDLRTIVSNIIRVGFRDHNPLVIEWIVRLCNQHLRDVVDGLHVNNPELNNFVVVGGSPGAISGATASSTGPVKDEPMEEEGSVSMEEDEDWSEAKESLEEEKPGTRARGAIIVIVV